MQYVGEELRESEDASILMTLMLAIGRFPCGRVVAFTADDLDTVADAPFAEWAVPVQYDAIARALWRFVHCELTVPELDFRGPLLSYVDAREAPTDFKVRFNPAFASFFHSRLLLALLGMANQ
jgi:hypothetical protein